MQPKDPAGPLQFAQFKDAHPYVEGDRLRRKTDEKEPVAVADRPQKNNPAR